MKSIHGTAWGLFLTIAGLTFALGFSALTFAGQDNNHPCPCVAEEYKSEKGYSLYKEAVQDWKARKWQDAVLKHRQVIEKYPDSPLAAQSHIATGLFLKYHKLYEEAIPEFQKGISMIPDTRYARDAKTSLACIYTSQGKYDEALGILREVSAKAKDWDEIKYCSYWAKEIKRLKTQKYSYLKSCGPKALATVFRLKGIRIQPKDLSLKGVKNGLASMQDLRKAAMAKGLKATGVQISLSDLKTMEMPAIALLKPGHYIVISSVDQKGFTVIDPARGEKAFTMSEAALQKSWTGYVLLFSDKLRTESGYALLTKDTMKRTLGGVCDCCPTGRNGPPGENPGGEFDDPPSIFVNMVNLNLVVQNADLSYSGLGPNVEITRTYNADDPRESAFGRSWTHNYNTYLVEEPTGDVLVHRGGGKIDRFYYIDNSSAGMNGIWNVNLVCTSTTCPDWSSVGDTVTTTLRATQSGNELTAYLYDLGCEMNGTVDGNFFNLSGYWMEEDSGCIIKNDLLMEGVFDESLLSGNSTLAVTPMPPIDPNCAGMVGFGCEEIFTTTGVRKMSETGYITYEPGVYDTLIKNEDNSWSLKIKKDKTTQHFDPNGRLIDISDKNGNKLVYGYDSNNKLVAITDAAGRITTFTYGTNNKISRITDPIGRYFSYTYDANNNLISATDMAGYTTSYTYNELSYMTAITIPKGTTNINYYFDEEEGYCTLTSIFDAMGYGRWYNIYWTSGEDDVMVTDAHGNTTYYDNTDEGMTKAITDPLGNTTSFGYDIFGNRKSITNPNGNTTNSIYDEQGNITTVTNPLGDVTTFTYDDKDNLIQLKDPLNRIYSYIYDSNNNLTKVTDPLNNQTNFTYDSHGQLINLTDARSNSTSFAYDTNGNQISSTDPCGHTTNYTYDGAGRVKSRTDAKGNTIKYIHDGLNRITEANYPDGRIQYNYDSSTLTSVTGKDEQIINFEYNGLDRMTRVVYPGGKTVQYGYDALGNRTSITYPDGQVVYYWYDWANRLTRVRDWMINNTVYTYDPAGNLTSMKYLPYGIVATYLYDNASRLISLETKRSDNSIICSYQYTLNAAGNRMAISAVQPLEPNIPYQDIHYTYNQDNQLLTANEVTFQYDENGNLVSKTEDGNTTNYIYDYDNRLVQVTIGGDVYQYKYDVFGNRVAKIKNGETTRYFIDINRLLPAVLAEADQYGNIQANYIYGLGLISRIDDWWDALYYHYDGVGSTVAITDQSGYIVNKYAYTPFGVPAGVEEWIPNPFRYVGRFGVMDDENGLLYMRARYYSPSAGRFVNKDPGGFVGGLNAYTYVANNPTGLIDPFGLWEVGISVGPFGFSFGHNTTTGQFSFGASVGFGGGLYIAPTSQPVSGATVSGFAGWGHYGGYFSGVLNRIGLGGQLNGALGNPDPYGQPTFSGAGWGIGGGWTWTWDGNTNSKGK